MWKYLIFAVLFTACSVSTKVTHNIVDKDVNFSKIKNGVWEVYAIQKIKTKAKGFALDFKITKEKLLNSFVKTAEKNLKQTEINIGYRELPKALTQEFSKKNQMELLKFVKETKANYLVFLSDAGAVHETELINTPTGSKKIVASSTLYEIIVNIWDVKQWKIIVSYGISQSGGGDLQDLTSKAVEYIIKNGKL